jgi:hypothetical protein
MWNPAKTGILVDRGEGVLAFVETGPEFEELSKSAADWHEADASQPPPIPIEEERASMICTPAQMRLTLHRLGLKDDIQAIADSDPEASIVWEYATQIYRQSPFIAALENADYTPERIDEIFRAAMEVQV